MTDLPRIAVTSGEPAGIGPDLCLLMAQQQFPAELIIIADRVLLEQRATMLGLDLCFESYIPDSRPTISPAGTLKVLEVSAASETSCGELNTANASYVINLLDIASQGCLRGDFDAMVTAPLHKGVINDAGRTFSGHTEYLSEKTGNPHPVMMLATPTLRVALMTTHLPLSHVASAITYERILTVTRILRQDLHRWFGLSHPKIAVCGLNPHAGEGGHLGREELDIIIPALETLSAEGIDVRGPLPADTAFIPEQLDISDVVLAMYHDQGLPVLKHQGFGDAVNITLGLPIIRTSVDHGTALDLAGTGNIDQGSLYAAISTAIDMAQSSQGQ